MSATAPLLEVDALLAEMARLEELRLMLALGVIEREHGAVVGGDAAAAPADGPPETPVQGRSPVRDGAGEVPEPGHLLRRGMRMCQLVGLGAVLFTIWALVGTGLLERVHQGHLRHELLHRAAGPPAATGRAVATIDINRLGIHQVIAEGVSAAVLRGGPGHVPGSADPGAAGTMTVAGHRTTMGGPFRRIGSLRVGDEVSVTRPGLDVHYYVTAPPRRDQLSDGTPRLLLVTADPAYQARRTLWVWAAADLPRMPGAPPPREVRWAGSSTDAGLAMLLAALLLAVAAGWIGRPSRRGWPMAIGGAAGVLVLCWLALGAGSPLL